MVHKLYKIEYIRNPITEKNTKEIIETTLANEMTIQNMFLAKNKTSLYLIVESYLDLDNVCNSLENYNGYGLFNVSEIIKIQY